jgi:hypothetical protein
MLKISDFYLDKQKGFIPKKIWSVAKQINKSTNGGQIQNNLTDIN